MFSSDELERYARHLVIRDVGGAGQQTLKRARVAVIGAGGLGSPVTLYLAAAGVGTLRLIDDDKVSLSNLQRQVLYQTTQAETGALKVEAASEAVAKLNPHVNTEARCLRFCEANADALLDGIDVAVDGSDSFATRQQIAEACERAAVPLVTGAVDLFDGSLTVLTPYTSDKEGNRHPRFADLFASAPPEGLVANCEEVGVIGALTGVIGTLQAMEVIKLLTGLGEPLIGRLLLYDGRRAEFTTIRYRRKSD